MSTGDAHQREALIRLAASTAEAIVQTLERLAPGEVTRGDITILGDDVSPFASIAAGTAAAGVSYIDGASGANVFVAPAETVHVLAAGMGVADGADGAEAIAELELSAVGELANQMMSAAAGALGVVLGQEVEISPPTIRVIDAPATAEQLFGTAPHATSTTFTVSGRPCRLIQLIPSGFVVRVSQALEQLDGNVARHRGHAGDDPHQGLTDALGDIKLRVWAELGRTALPFRDALELPLGSVVELDRAVEAPVDLYVNGLRFAHGRLMVSDEERWVFCLDELIGEPTVPSLSIPTP